MIYRALGIGLTASAASSLASAAGYDRPIGDPHQSRSAIIAANGIVATSQPLASQAGLEILKQGGSALDAAIAANAVLGVVEPMSCGLGGDLFCIYWDNKTKKLYGLNGSGRSPYGLNRQVFEKLNLKQIPDEGPLSWSVPGCVAGWCDLHERFGALKLADVLAPAIRYADAGFPVSEIISAAWRASATDLSKWPDSAKTWLPHGQGPQCGEVFRNPRLAASLKLVAEGGADAFYRGPIAAEIARFSQANGGYLSAKDFADHKSIWVDPVSTNYRGYDVWELPPPGQGIAVLEILNLLEPYDLRSLGHNSAEHLHLFVEAKKLAYADRAKYYSDPEFNKIPVAELISKDYAARRGKLIDRNRAAANAPAGDPQLAKGDTVYLCAVDKDRNCCSLIQSNFYAFGSMVTPGEVGFVLQNRGCLFALDENHWNRLEPHKHPFHTIIPAMVTRQGKPWFVFGVMGGDMQPQGQAQVLMNVIDFGMNVQAAGDAARLRHIGSPTPTGLSADPDPGAVVVESGISDEVMAALRAKGHKVVKDPAANRGAFGGYQGILLDHEHGSLHGGSEPRNDGAAIGY